MDRIRALCSFVRGLSSQQAAVTTSAMSEQPSVQSTQMPPDKDVSPEMEQRSEQESLSFGAFIDTVAAIVDNNSVDGAEGDNDQTTNNHSIQVEIFLAGFLSPDKPMDIAFIRALLQSKFLLTAEQKRSRDQTSLARVFERISFAMCSLHRIGYSHAQIVMIDSDEMVWLSTHSRISATTLVKYFRFSAKLDRFWIQVFLNLEGVLHNPLHDLISSTYCGVLLLDLSTMGFGFSRDEMTRWTDDPAFHHLKRPTKSIRRGQFRKARQCMLHQPVRPSDPGHATTLTARSRSFAIALPLELRSQIYQCVIKHAFCVIDTTGAIGGRSEAITLFFSDEESESAFRSLSRVNRQLRNELRDHLQHLCVSSVPLVILPTTDTDTLDCQDELWENMVNFRHVRIAVTLHHCISLDAIVSKLRPTLARLLNFPGLARLSVSVLLPSSQAPRSEVLPMDFWQKALKTTKPLNVSIYLTTEMKFQTPPHDQISAPTPTYIQVTEWPFTLWAHSVYRQDDQFRLLSLLCGHDLDTQTLYLLRACGFMDLLPASPSRCFSETESLLISRVLPVRKICTQTIPFSQFKRRHSKTEFGD